MTMSSQTTRRGIAVFTALLAGVAVPATLISSADAVTSARVTHHKVNDADHDGMPNRWENKFGLNPHKANARKDADHDHLRNIAEFRDGTDPSNADTDCDGMDDDDEVSDGNNATDPTDADSDNDGVSDGDEDGDHNGIDDGDEDGDNGDDSQCDDVDNNNDNSDNNSGTDRAASRSTWRTVS